MSETGRVWAALLIVVVLGGLIDSSLEAQEGEILAGPIWFGTEISIAPDPDAAELWRCQAELRDLLGEEVLSAPTIVFAAGERASVKSGLPSAMLWELEVEVGDKGGEAMWVSRVTLDGQVVSIAKGSVVLQSE